MSIPDHKSHANEPCQDIPSAASYRHIYGNWEYVRQTLSPSGLISRKALCGIHTYGVPNAVRDNPDE